MAETYTPPFEKYGLEAPEAASPPVESGQGEHTPPTTPDAPQEGYTPPWQKYGMSDPLSHAPAKDDTETIARTAEQKFIESAAKPKKPTLSWVEQVGRAAFFDLTDKATAALVHRNLREQHPDLSYEQTLRMVRGVLDEEQSTSADIAGMLTPGVGVGKAVAGAGRLGLSAVQKTGVAKGAMRWAARNPKLAGVIQTAAEGAGGGVAFEAIRSATENAVDSEAGLDTESVIDATLTGGIVGGLLAPPVQGAARMAGEGVKAAVGYVGRMLGATGPQAAQATQRVLRAAARPGETMDVTLARLQASAQDFAVANGRAPALAEIMPVEAVEDIAGIARHYKGLDQRARELSDEQIGEVVGSFDSFLNAGAKLKDTSTIKKQANRMFSSLMRRHGNVPVTVPDDSLDVLARNTDWLEQQVKAGSPAAKEIKSVVEARDGIGKLRRKFNDLAGRQNVAVMRQEVADLKEELATLIRERVEGGEVDASEEAVLGVLVKYRDAVTNAVAKAEEAGRATMNTDEFLPVLRNAEMVLDRYNRDGLKVRLSDVNMLRAAASDHAFTETDAAKRQIARAINGAVSQIGKDEIPMYGRVVDTFSKAMTRMEAQAAGRAAVRGSESAENLGVLAESGLTPKGKQIGPERITAVREGATEGAKLELRGAARGTRREVASATRKISDSDEIKNAIRAVAPKEADAIIERSAQVSKSIDNLEALASVKSPSSLNSDQQAAKMVLEGIVAHRLGGAALAQLGAWLFTRARIPRGTATKVIEMLADPGQSDKALAYMVRRKVNMAGFVGAVVAELERTSR